MVGRPPCSRIRYQLDVQAADEKAINTFLLAGARPSLLGGLGALANVTLTSYETLLLDDERFGALRRIEEGVKVDEDRLAFDVIGRALAGEAVLGQEHTLRHLHSGEVWRPELAVREGMIDGCPSARTALDRARSTAARIIDTHMVEPPAESAREAIA